MVKKVIQFEQELEKFKPVLDINRIEEEIESDDIKDLANIIKEIIAQQNE